MGEKDQSELQPPDGLSQSGQEVTFLDGLDVADGKCSGKARVGAAPDELVKMAAGI